MSNRFVGTSNEISRQKPRILKRKSSGCPPQGAIDVNYNILKYYSNWQFGYTNFGGVLQTLVVDSALRRLIIETNPGINYWKQGVGSDAIINGNFESNSDWDSLGWAIIGGQAVTYIGGVGLPEKTIKQDTLSIGTKYEAQAIVTKLTQGYVYISIGGSDSSQLVGPISGNQIITHTGTAGTEQIRITASSEADAEVTLIRAIPFVGSALDYRVHENSFMALSNHFFNNVGQLTQFASENRADYSLDLFKDVRDFEVNKDVVLNGDFSLGTLNWALGSNWAVAGGTANHTVGSTDPLTQSSIFIDDTDYQINYTITNRTAGDVRVSCGSGSLGELRTVDGLYTEIFTNAGSLDLIFTPSSDFNGSISLVRAGRMPLPSEDIDPLKGCLMEYFLFKVKLYPCQEGWLYMELNDLALAGWDGEKDEVIYVVGWEGDVDRQPESLAGVTYLNQLSQTLEPAHYVNQGQLGLYILNNGVNGFAGTKQITHGSVRFSEIVAQEGSNKKLSIYLNTQKEKGEEVYYNVLVGLRPSDLKTDNIQEVGNREKGPPPTITIPESEQRIGITYDGWADTDLSLTASSITFKFDKEQTFIDAPLFSVREGVLDSSPNSVSKDERFVLKPNCRYITTGRVISPGSVFGPPIVDDNPAGNDLIEAFERRRMFDPGIEYTANGGYSFALSHRPHIAGNPDVTNRRAVSTTVCNNTFDSGVLGSASFPEVMVFNRVKWEAEATWRVRLPMTWGLYGGFWQIYEDAIRSDNSRWGTITPMDLHLYRYDDFEPNLSGVPGNMFNYNYDDFRDGVTKIHSFGANDFGPPQVPYLYRGTYEPENNRTFPVFYLPSTINRQIWLTIDTTIGNESIQALEAKYFLIFGDSDTQTGFFSKAYDTEYYVSPTDYNQRQYQVNNISMLRMVNKQVQDFTQTDNLWDIGVMAFQPSAFLPKGTDRT